METLKRYGAFAPLLILGMLAAGCSDVTFGNIGEDFEGVYDYVGTVNGKPGDVVSGTLTITRQRGDRANVFIDWRYFNDGVQILRITTNRAATADLDSDGDISFDFEGDLFLDGLRTDFLLTHDGFLDDRRDTITGTWRLITDLPTTDRGAFIARE